MKKTKTKTILGIFGLIVFISTIIYIKVANIYGFFLEDRILMFIIVSIVFIISIFFIFRYIDTLNI